MMVCLDDWIPQTFTRNAFATTVALLLFAAPALGQQIHRQSFEGETTKLKLGLTDGRIELREHELSKQLAHTAAQSERMVIRATTGNVCHVDYEFGKTFLLEELTLSAWVRSNRSGVKLLARVILPNEVHPETKEALSLFLVGDIYDDLNRWRRLMIRRPDVLLERQRQLLQSERKTTINIKGAYIDKVVFDVFTGLGDIEIHIDDIEVGPMAFSNDRLGAKDPTATPAPVRDMDGQKLDLAQPKIREQRDMLRSAVIGDRMIVGDKPFFMRGIYRTDAPLVMLRDAGFNTVVVDWPVASGTLAEIEKNRFRTLPIVPLQPSDYQPYRFAGDQPLQLHDRSLGVLIGPRMDRASDPVVSQVLTNIRSRDTDRNRPITTDVREGLRLYSRKLDMVGASRYPLQTSLTLDNGYKWLSQRRNLAKPGVYFWTWIQTHADEQYSRMVLGRELTRRHESPIGPQPDQIRVWTYMALAAGYRGILYSSDRALSEPADGRARMLRVALTNLELTLIEPFIAGGRAPVIASTSRPDVMAVVFRHERGVLVIPIYRDADSQYVLGQAAMNDLQVVVENAPEAAQAFQVNLGSVRGLKRKAEAAGIRITIPEFDTVALIVLTGDTSLYATFQETAQQFASLAANWQRELAELELTNTEATLARLETLGQPRAFAEMLAEARGYLDESRAARETNNPRLVVEKAQRSLRIVRFVQHKAWKSAVQKVGSPVSDPFLVSFSTLPESAQFQKAIGQAKFGENLVSTGDFEKEGNLDAYGWTYVPKTSDQLEAAALLVGVNPYRGKRALELNVRPAPTTLAPTTVENTRVEMISPPVRVRPGDLVRISGFVQLPETCKGSVDGAMVWDSLAGEALAARFTDASGWKNFVLYRPVHQTGDLRVHLALTGVGAVRFDDLRVEISENVPTPLAGRERQVPTK